MVDAKADDSVKFWDLVSGQYDAIADEQIDRRQRQSILEYLSAEKNLGRAVELGCGTGYCTQALARAADSVIATDNSEGMLAQARERLRDVTNATVQKEDCTKTSFKDASFDTAFMALLLDHLPEPARALAEVRRILKPGGALIIANPDWSFVPESHKMMSRYMFLSRYGDAQARYPQDIRDLPHQVLKDMLEAAGFKVNRTEFVSGDTSPMGCTLEYVRAAKKTDDFDVLMSIMASAGRAENVISVQHLIHKYGQLTAVNSVSFNVRKGEVFALVGPNGAGKTTIVEILECLKTPTRGYVSVSGDAVMTGVGAGVNPYPGEKRNFRRIKERIGVLPQSFNAFDLLTVRENLDYFARMYPKHVDIDRLIAEFGLEDKRDTLFKNLSGGLKQRVGITLALVNDPEIVFLDEPSAGLDPRSRRDVWEAIRKLKGRGKTVFLTTHYMDEAQHLADQVCIIHHGSIVAEGSPEDLINKYGGGNTLVVRGCSPGAPEQLIKAIPESRVEGVDVLARLPGEDGMSGLSRAIEIVKAGGFTCKEIYVKKPTLDDVFLNLTGEATVDAAEGPNRVKSNDLQKIAERGR